MGLFLAGLWPNATIAENPIFAAAQQGNVFKRANLQMLTDLGLNIHTPNNNETPTFAAAQRGMYPLSSINKLGATSAPLIIMEKRHFLQRPNRGMCRYSCIG